MSASEVGQVRIATDVGGARADYEDVEVGRSLGSARLAFTQAEVDAICERFESYHPWYSVHSPFGGTIVPVASTFAVGRRLLSEAYNIVGLFYGWSFESTHPLLVGREYTFRASIAEKWIQNDREFVAYVGQCTDADGTVMFTTRRSHALDYLKRTVPKTGDGGLESRPAAGAPGAATCAPETTGAFDVVVPDAPVAIRPVATSDTVPGAWLPSHAKAMTEAILERESLKGAGGVRHHSHEAARREGHHRSFAGGPGLMDLVHRSALQFFGRGWVEGGAADLTMVRPVYEGEFVYSQAVVTNAESLPDESRRLTCDAWIENQAGEKKVRGTVSGIVRPPEAPEARGADLDRNRAESEG